MSNALTKYSVGSLKELWTISWPAMITSASGCFMIFGDRFILSFYSQEAFNANIGAMPWYWTFLFTFLNLIGVASVFVGQLNGKKSFNQIGNAVNHMLLMCAALWIVVVPIVLWLTPVLLAKNLESLGNQYLRIMLMFLPIHCASAGAFASFFIGRGKTRIVTIVSIIASLLNLVFDVWFVFGGLGVPEMGINGAAWATGLAQCIELVIFAAIYFNRNNIKNYGTTEFELDKDILKSFAKVGTPNAISCLFNCITWGWTMQLLAIYTPQDDFTAYGIANSIYLLIFFVIEGVGDGVGIVCSNAIGAKKYEFVSKNIVSAAKLLLLCSIAIIIPAIIFSDQLIYAFVQKTSDISILHNTKIMINFMFLIFIIEGFWFIFQKVLNSA